MNDYLSSTDSGSEELTPEEKKYIQQLEGSQTYDEWGNLIGSAAGTALGVGLAPLTGGASLGFIPALAGLGGAAGSMIGSNIGSGQATEAQKKLDELRAKREKPNLEQQARWAAFNKLLGKYSSF